MMASYNSTASDWESSCSEYSEDHHKIVTNDEPDKPIDNEESDKRLNAHQDGLKWNKKSEEKSDKDRRKPFYVPRNPAFFQHDLRLIDEEDEEEDGYDKNKKDESNCWKHDMYDEEKQMPKSRKEIIDSYGYDIRSDSSKSDNRYKHKKRSNYTNPRNDFIDGSHKENGNCFNNNHLKPSSNYKKKNISSDIKSQSRGKHNRGTDSLEKNTVKKNVEEEKTLEKFTKKKTLEKFTEKSKNLSDDLKIIYVDDLSLQNKKPLSSQRKGDCRIPSSVAVDGSSKKNLPEKFTIPQRLVVVNNEKTVVPPVRYPDNSKNQTQLSNKKYTNPCKAEVKENLFNCENVVSIKKNLNRPYYNSASNWSGAYSYERVHSPLNIAAKLQHVSEIEDQNIRKNNNVLRTALESVAESPSYDLFSALCPYSTDENGENFTFPDPPDLSANHLTPWMSSQQHYYMQPYYQQNADTPVHWAYYSPPGYHHGSNIAIVKQQYYSSWSLPQNTCLTSQTSSSEPFYIVPDDGSRCLSLNSPLPLQLHSLDLHY